MPDGDDIAMSDRSEELTESRGEAASTDDLLEETERLLSGTGDGVEADRGGRATDDASRSTDPAARPAGGAEADGTTREGTRGSRLGRLSAGLSPGDLFSPRAFLALVLLLGVALLAGNAVVPLFGIGGPIAALVVAFLVGLVTSKRRYLEVSSAGGVAGAVASLLSLDLVVALAVSIEMPLLIGAVAGLVASVVGYYFGRDLRAGLTREVE